MNPDVALCIPFRDRGKDPLRQMNLDCVVNYWQHHGFEPQVFADGREGDAQFNRSAAYNRAVATNPDARVFVFTESDMIVAPHQIDLAVMSATKRPGLVIPFSQYVALTPQGSHACRVGRVTIAPSLQSAAYVMADCRAVGAVNVVSRESLELVGGYDEAFEGSWYDDNAMERAFEVTCDSGARFIPGSGYHLHHLPGWQGDHLTDEDKAASERNGKRLKLYEKATTPEQIRKLTER